MKANDPIPYNKTQRFNTHRDVKKQSATYNYKW